MRLTCRILPTGLKGNQEEEEKASLYKGAFLERQL